LAVRDSRLRAAVPFYGHAAYHELELRHIACPVMAFYGRRDGVTQELADIVPHMAHAGVRFTPVVYDDAGPSFFNESIAATYNRTAAEDSWHRLVSFLRLALI
jgi:carboxymethylenebutenolidase